MQQVALYTITRSIYTISYTILQLKMDKCRACGSAYQTSEVQMRSADEAHTSITSCPNCPVDINKIDSNKVPSNPVMGINRRVRRSISVVPRRYSISSSIYSIVFDIPNNHEFMKVNLPMHHLTALTPFYGNNDLHNNIVSAAYTVIDGMFKDMCIRFKDRKAIGIGAYIDTYDMLRSSTGSNSDNVAVRRGNYVLDNTLDIRYPCYIYNEFNSKSRSYIIELGYNAPSTNIIKGIINTVYNINMLPQNVSKHISNDTIAKLNNLSPRGWDASAPPKSGYTFTCKPDGQNIWLFWIGHIWYKFGPRCKGGIKSWMWSDTINSSDMIIVNVEDMMSYGCIVIDCFTDDKGNIASSTRDINWIVHISNNISVLCPDVPLITREYFKDYDSALKYTGNLSYPIDGIVAIRDGSTEMLKIKSVKSMELRLNEDGILYTSDSIPVIKCPDNIASKHTGKDAILEVRFKVVNNNNIHVTDIFPRTDKTLANNSNAVSNIMRSAYNVLTPDDNDRRMALLWCNDLRKHIYDRVSSYNTTRSIIVDIGTGTGQSLDSMSHMENVSFIHIEPDSTRCKSIARRLNIQKVITNINDIITSIRQLKTRAVKHEILNCSIGDLIANHKVSELIFSEARCVTCTFSMQFIIKELNYIRSVHNLSIFGCGYVYDNMNSKGILIDKCGVLMKQVNDKEASISWGGDKKYNEPITLIRDYAGIGNIIPGSDLISLPGSRVSTNARAICKNVYAILPS